MRLVGVAVAALIIAAAIPVTASAQPMQEVLPACRDLDQGIRPADIIAAGYQATCLTGIATAMAAAGLIPNDAICLPNGLRPMEAASLIALYAGQNPRYLNEDYPSAVVSIMMELWSCD